jgi:cytoskeleton protein RodZ
MADIGTTLREARIRARIDISEVEARTKIRAKYLRAIENEEWDLLPGPVYVKSFLRTYGDFLGLDSRQLVDEFKRRYERPTDQELRPMGSIARERRERERRRRRPRLGPLGAVVIVLAAVVAALFVVGSLGSKNSPTTPTTPSTPTVVSGTGSSTSTSTSSTTRSSAPPVHHVHHAPKPSTVTLKLVPTNSVYICVVDGSGKILIAGETFSAGQSVPVETAHKLMITLGNGAVQMQVNGKPVTLAPGSPIGYQITPGKTSLLPAAQQPTCT